MESSAKAKAERARRVEAEASNRPAALVGLWHVSASVVLSLKFQRYGAGLAERVTTV